MHLGVSVADVSGGLTALDRYGISGLPGGVGGWRCGAGVVRQRARWAGVGRLLHAGREPVPVSGDPAPAHVRDDRIVELRREGWSLAQIGPNST